MLQHQTLREILEDPLIAQIAPHAISRWDLTKEDLFEGLRRLHLSQWHRRYDNPCVMDGTQWALTIAFSNGFRTIHITGSNAYPYNFQDLRNLFGILQNEERGAEQVLYCEVYRVVQQTYSLSDGGHLLHCRENL